MKELLLSRPTEISAHELHKQVYDLCAGAGQPPQVHLWGFWRGGCGAW